MEPDAEKAFLTSHKSHHPRHLLARWRRVAKATGLKVGTLAKDAKYPIVCLAPQRPREGKTLYLSAGIHGDESAGILGLLIWAEENPLHLASCDVLIFPLFNPHGLAENTRRDSRQRDLNRCFHDPRSCESIQAWQDLVADRSFDACLCLHEDYDAQGCYLYELTREAKPLGPSLLDASNRYIPSDPRRTIDGRRLSARGIFQRKRSPKMPEKPEAIVLFDHHTNLSITFETPSEWSLWHRVRAQVAAIETVTRHILDDPQRTTEINP